jgi:alanine dehydrogenase
MQFLILDKNVVKKNIEMPVVIEAVEAILIAYARGEAHMPCKVYLDVPEGDFRAMPAYVPGAAGVKWINVHPHNPERTTLPTVMGLILYNDPATGQPLALIDGTLITQFRTGAVAAVASRRLARPGAQTLGMVGCGGQALTHLMALTQVLRPSRIYLSDPRREAAERLAGEFKQFDCRVAGLEETCGADVITTITPSRKPLVRREWVKPGAHINAMGADAPGKQELDMDLLLASRIYVDDWTQASHSGEINVAVQEGRLTHAQIAGTLPEVLAGRVAGRGGNDEITIFDSTGLAIQDLAVAKLVYEQARARGEGLMVDFELG